MVFIVILRFDRDNRVVHGHLVVVHVDADGGALLLLLPIPGRHPVRGPGVRVHVEAGVGQGHAVVVHVDGAALRLPWSRAAATEDSQAHTSCRLAPAPGFEGAGLVEVAMFATRAALRLPWSRAFKADIVQEMGGGAFYSQAQVASSLGILFSNISLLMHPSARTRHHMPAAAATTIPRLSFDSQRSHGPDFELN